MQQILLQLTDEATGEFDPIGTLIVLVLLVVFLYLSKWTWERSGRTSGVRTWLWRGGTAVFSVLSVLVLVALGMNLLAAAGVI